jgi:hypothetical protein
MDSAYATSVAIVRRIAQMELARIAVGETSTRDGKGKAVPPEKEIVAAK